VRDNAGELNAEPGIDPAKDARSTLDTMTTFVRLLNVTEPRHLAAVAPEHLI
jgi:hypothetical protein